MALDQTIKTTAVSVSTTATELPEDPLTDREGLIIQNLGAADLFIGGEDVTAASGIKLVAGQVFSSEQFGPRASIYGIVASGTADVRAMELS